MKIVNFKKEYFQKNIDEGIILGRKGFKKIINCISKLPKNAKILDVGCGKGSYLKEIYKYRPDLKLYGVDIGEVEKFLPKHIFFIKGSGEKLPFKDGIFDFIFCFHVLEHVLNPHDFMMEFYRILKKEGYVYIEMPYYKTAYIPDGSMNFWSDVTHVRPYNYNSAERLLSENGFKVIEIKIWRNYKSIMLGPYLILKRILFNDRDALSTFFANLYGNSIGALGKM